MFATLIRRAPKEPVKETLSKRTPLTMANNPYKTRRVWPPDFKELSPQQQLHYEKKWKRRLALACYSPKWVKGIKYAQFATIIAALIWLFFYAEFEWWGQKYKPSEEMVQKFKYLWGAMAPEKRYERPRDAPPPPPPKEDGADPKSKK